MSVKEKAGMVGQMAKSKVRDVKLDTVQERNERLKMKNDLLREELSQEREERERILDALERVGRPKRHRVRGLFVLSAAAGTAYVMGSKAGRERYDQLRTWFDDMRGRGGDFDASGWAQEAKDTASRASSGMQNFGERASSTIQEKGTQSAGTVQQTATSAGQKVEEKTNSAADKVEKNTSSGSSSSTGSGSSGSSSSGGSTGGTSSTGRSSSGS